LDVPLIGSLNAGAYWAFRARDLVALVAYSTIYKAIVWFKKIKIKIKIKSKALKFLLLV
jgi:hypothetical protein